MRTCTILCIFVTVLFFSAVDALADVPSYINFQGTLADSNGNPITDTLQMDFTIYDIDVGGTPLWGESHSAVEISDGLYRIQLGSVSAIPDSIFDGNTLWLGITIDPDTEELIPRQSLVTVPYAFRVMKAQYSDTADVARIGSPDDDWVISGDNITHEIGNVGIGITDLGERLNVEGNLKLGTHDEIQFGGIPLNYTRISGLGANLSIYSHNDTYIRAYNKIYFGTRSGSGGSDWICFDGSVPGVRIGSSGSPVNMMDVEGEMAVGSGYAGNAAPEDGMLVEGDVGIGTYPPEAKLHVYRLATNDYEKAIYGVVHPSSIFEDDGLYGVYGQTNCYTTNNPGAGVMGYASESGGAAAGVQGQAEGQTGKGLYGVALNTSGVNYGLYAQTNSTDGYAGYFLGGKNYFEGNVGIGTDAPAVKLDVQGNLNVGLAGTGYDVNFYGDFFDGRLYWNQGKMALRLGRDTDGTHWDPDSIGLYSFASGENTKALGNSSISLGDGSEARESQSCAIGFHARSIGTASIALGYHTYASGQGAVALGQSTDAIGSNSTAMGYNSTASGVTSTAMGAYATASGYSSIAAGSYVTAGTADFTIVIGRGINSSLPLVNNVNNSLMVGFNTTTPTLFVGGSDHRVGIGTDVPVGKLQVAGNVKVDSTIEIRDFKMTTGASDGYILTSNASGEGTWQAAPSIDDGDWTISGNDVYRDSGNVGIGTSTPETDLHVEGTITVDQKIQADDSGGLEFATDEGTTRLWMTDWGEIGILTSTPETELHVEGTITVDQEIRADDEGGLEFLTDDGVTRLIIADDGNVGIGTTNPDKKLTVVGDFGVYPNSTESVITTDNWNVKLGDPDGVGNQVFFEIDNPNTKFTFNNGDVGIGTSSPDYPLHVVNPSDDNFSSAIYGLSSATGTGQQIWGVVGETNSAAISNAGAGVLGCASNVDGHGTGVRGITEGINGKALSGYANHSTGINYGIYAKTLSDSGYAGYFFGGRNYFQGNVGVGIENPTARLHILEWNCGSALNVVSTYQYYLGQLVNLERTQIAPLLDDMLQIKVPEGSVNNSQFIECERGDSVKFRVNVDGNVFADGAFTGPADFSEMVKVSSGASNVEPGDVLVIDQYNFRATVKSWQSRSTLVAGIYSTNPGFIGSERDWDKPAEQITEEQGTYTRDEMAAQFNEIPMAVVGIVPCKVSAENGAIRPGDLLVTSSTPGHAMRDDNPQVGTVIGKALEPFSSGTGIIKVLVTLH